MRLRAMQGRRIGDLRSDAASAAAGAMTGATVTLPPGVRLARVVTHDAPPGGDLDIRTEPEDGAPQIPGGGAEKDGIVAVMNANAGNGYSEVIWPGGARRQGGEGFAHSKFLAFLPAGDPNAPPGAPGTGPTDDGGFPIMTVAAIGVGVLALGGLAWYALR
jgi:hypothetical protein